MERGKRLFAKSKAEDIEYVREWFRGRLGSLASSASSRESLREEDIPPGEEVWDVCREGVEEAREASSRESRGGAGERALILE